MIIPSEDLASETQRVLREIFYFLGLPAYNIKNTEKVNVSKYSKMDQDTRKILIEFFKPHNERLFKFIGKKFDWDE